MSAQDDHIPAFGRLPRSPEAIALWSRLTREMELPGQQQVMRSLAALREFARTFEELPEELLRALDGFAEQCADPGVDIADAGSSDDSRHSDPTHTFYGYLNSHPEYCALGMPPPKDQDPRPFRLVQLALVASSSLRSELVHNRNFYSSRRDASLACRLLHKRPVVYRFVSEAAEGAGSLAAFAERLSSICIGDRHFVDNPLDNETRNRLNAIRRLIDYATGDRLPVQRATTTHSTRSVGQPQQDPESFTAEIPLVIETEPSSQDRQTRIQAGAAPQGEGRRPQHVAISVSHDASARNRSTRAQFRSVSYRARAIKTQAQQLPTSGDRLQLHDLEALLSWFTSTARGRAEEELAKQFTAASFLIGADFNVVKQIRIAAQSSHVTEDDPGVPWLVLRDAMWRRQVIPPEAAFQPDAGDAHLYEPVSDWLTLPLPRGLPVVDRLLERGARQGTGLLFQGRVDDWQAVLREILNKLNRHHRTRLTIPRIARFIPRFLSDVKGDRAVGSLLGAAHDPRGCAARLYYYAPKTAYLVHAYTEEVTRLCGLATGHAPVSFPAPKTLLKNDERVGSAGVPRTEAVQVAVAALKTSIPRLGRGRPKATDLVAFHNAYTAYTATMALWATGIRAIRDPIELELTDVQAGFLTVSDKDGDEYADARVLWIAPVLREQLRHYGRHRQRLLDNSAFSRLRVASPGWLFFIDDGQPCQVTPSSLERFRHPGYRFRSNAQRHYLRTHLREHEVSGLVVDAWLGHGRFGEEAYGRYSCLSPLDVRDAVAGPLTGLLDELGWTAIGGLAR